MKHGQRKKTGAVKGTALWERIAKKHIGEITDNGEGVHRFVHSFHGASS